MSKETSVQIGPGFLGMLGLLFIALKLTGYIDWAWWLVLLPLYGPRAFVLCVLLAGLIILGIAGFIDGIIERVSKK